MMLYADVHTFIVTAAVTYADRLRILRTYVSLHIYLSNQLPVRIELLCIYANAGLTNHHHHHRQCIVTLCLGFQDALKVI